MARRDGKARVSGQVLEKAASDVYLDEGFDRFHKGEDPARGIWNIDVALIVARKAIFVYVTEL